MTQTEKKKVIEKLIEQPKTQKRLFWGREIKSLNILIESYPIDGFWKGLSFPKKLDSIMLTEYLDKYAETGKEYVRVLQQIIKQNNLTDFDEVKLMPSSIDLESLI